MRFLGSLTNSLLIKSLASLEMLSNSSALKSQVAVVTFDSVSCSLSPMKGDKPDNLKHTSLNIGFLHTGAIVNPSYDVPMIF